MYLPIYLSIQMDRYIRMYKCLYVLSEVLRKLLTPLQRFRHVLFGGGSGFRD